MKKIKDNQCKVCGCTDSQACKGGCFWVEKGLCSKCAMKELKKKRREVVKELKKLELICKYRDQVWKERIKTVKNQRFERGERPWCVVCVDRFVKELLKQTKQK